MAAAAEARAAWQRAANRCLAQEDRKRAPKLACCPSSSELQHGTNHGNCTNSEDRPISNFMPLSRNPMNSNLPPDIRWWLQLQPTSGLQKDLASEQLYFSDREIGEKEVDDSATKLKNEEPSFCETETPDTNPENSVDVIEPPLLVSTAFMNHSCEIGLDESKNNVGYSHVPLKCIGNASIGDCLYKDKEFLDFKRFDPPPSNNPEKANFDMNAPWKEGEKAQPWWRMVDDNALASLVAERGMQHIENCDLPRPAQAVCVHGTESPNHENIGQFLGSLSPSSRVSRSYPGQCEHTYCSYSTASTDDMDLSDVGVCQENERNNTYRGEQEFCGSSNTKPGRKQAYQTLDRAQLLEALRHSQTRAREAEMAAKKAHNEKDDAIKILLRQASHLFACKQWLKILQLENICLQLKHKEHQIAAMMSELPWMTPKEKPTPGQGRKDWARRKGRRQKKGGGFFDAILFAVGLGLAGAGLLLGWTLGWLLPKL